SAAAGPARPTGAATRAVTREAMRIVIDGIDYQGGRRFARSARTGVRSVRMQVAELWRYPVKSLQGERVDAVAVGPHGLEGDRQLAIYDLATGFGLTGRRVPELLFASARLRDDGRAEITLPDGSVAA